MRATAFRIASEFLTNKRESNISLLKTINYIVHAIETHCLQPKNSDGGSEIDSDLVSDFYRGLFSDLTIDNEESQELKDFFTNNLPDSSSLAKVRFLAFKVASEYLPSSGKEEDGDEADGTDDADDDDSKEKGLKLLRCINAIVHAFEVTCLQPKPLQLKEDEKTAGGTDLSNMTLSDAVQYLWKLDVNRLDPTRDYKINVQEVRISSGSFVPNLKKKEKKKNYSSFWCFHVIYCTRRISSQSNSLCLFLFSFLD